MSERLVDVHHHFLPDDYRTALEAAGQNPPDGIARLPSWSEDEAVRFIDAIGIETAYLSISSPGVLLEGADVAGLARSCNDTAAGLISRHPGRFGAFAALPLPDVDASLAEIERALDELRLDGVGVLTHHGGTYLGDRALDPVMDELQRRRAVVFIHPSSPLCCQQSTLDIPGPVLEFIFDAARAVANLIYSGTFDRCPDITWIVPHGGGVLPAISARLEAVAALRPGRSHAAAPVATYLSGLAYDLAGPRSDAALHALLAIASVDRVLYGSDWPFTPEPGVAAMLGAITSSTALGDDPLAVLTANARHVLGRQVGQ